MSVRLFIGNLPYSATEADLRALFSEVAEPSQVVLPTDRETGRPRGFAFVDFAERDHAEQVINRYNGQPFSGRPLAVSEARAREDRPAGPRPGGYGGGGFGGGAPRPGGFGGPPSGGGFGGPRPGGPPRPGGFAPRDGGGMPPTGPEVSRRARGPVKGPIRKQTYDKPRGPIKQRPVSRLYDDEEDLVETTVDFDDVAASRAAADAPDGDTPDGDAPDADGPDVDVRDDHTDDDE